LYFVVLSSFFVLRAIGEPSADESERRVKAERLYIDGTEYALYPGRD
jgi:hypothetical protein